MGRLQEDKGNKGCKIVCCWFHINSRTEDPESGIWARTCLLDCNCGALIGLLGHDIILMVEDA